MDRGMLSNLNIVSCGLIGDENPAAVIEKQVTVDISTQSHFDMQDTIDICCKMTWEIVF